MDLNFTPEELAFRHEVRNWVAQHLPEDIAQAPGWLTPLTSLFLHGNLMHLAGNMLFLWVFGDNVEDSMGHWRFLAFFLLCGVMAAFGHALSHPDSVQPLIGASAGHSASTAAAMAPPALPAPMTTVRPRRGPAMSGGGGRWAAVFSAGSARWTGARPTLPDYLPAIGRSRVRSTCGSNSRSA
jgi:membrane associated rhomboid family serine protease